MASLINWRLRGSLRSPKWRAFSQAKKSQETRLCCSGTRMTPLSFSQCWGVRRQKISMRPRHQLWPGTASIEGRKSCREAKHRKELIMRVIDSNRHKSDFFFFIFQFNLAFTAQIQVTRQTDDEARLQMKVMNIHKAAWYSTIVSAALSCTDKRDVRV